MFWKQATRVTGSLSTNKENSKKSKSNATTAMSHTKRVFSEPVENTDCLFEPFKRDGCNDNWTRRFRIQNLPESRVRIHHKMKKLGSTTVTIQNRFDKVVLFDKPTTPTLSLLHWFSQHTKKTTLAAGENQPTNWQGKVEGQVIKVAVFYQSPLHYILF